MNKSESKYFNTAIKMDDAFLELLEKKDFEFITVKEICEKAGVNRSTFYLHYETLDDLLTECNEYIVNKFIHSLGKDQLTRHDLRSKPVEELDFVTPEYLLPWLDFIKKNKRLFSTYLNKFSILTGQRNNKLLFKNVFDPILERYHVKQSDKPYMMLFYTEGIMAIAKLWVLNDCKEEPAQICKIIINCVTHEQT